MQRQRSVNRRTTVLQPTITSSRLGVTSLAIMPKVIHYSLLAQAHAFAYLRGFMADAVKIHTEQHGGNKHVHS